MGCLDGLVVLDLARRYPASLAAMYLADFGAQVIKIDPPPSGAGVKRGDFTEEQLAAYLPVDRNKRSLVLNLKVEAGREVLCRLAERADVLVEGFRPNVMERLGVGYSRLREINPRLIYCALTAFGQDGPYVDAGLPAHDGNFLAFAGVLSMIGQRNGQIYRPANLVGDWGGGAMHALVGILLALLARQHTGRGQLVDVGYVDAVIALNAPNNWDYFATGKPPKRGESRTTGGQPWGNPYRCKDGEYFVVEPPETHLWTNLCNALQRPDLIPYNWCDTLEQTDMVNRELAAIFATRTRDEWWQFFKNLGEQSTCAAPILNIDETFRDPQVLHRKMLVELEHPVLGRVKQTGIGIKLSDTAGEIRHLGVPTGADTEAVLGELGYTAVDIARFRSEGAIGLTST